MRSLSTRSVALPVGGGAHPADGRSVVLAVHRRRPPLRDKGQGPHGRLARGWRRAEPRRPSLPASSLTHTFTVAGTSTTKTEPLSNPDDITQLGRRHLRRLPEWRRPAGPSQCRRQPGQHRGRDDHERARARAVGRRRQDGRGDGRPRHGHGHRDGERGCQLVALRHHARVGEVACSTTNTTTSHCPTTAGPTPSPS